MGTHQIHPGSQASRLEEHCTQSKAKQNKAKQSKAKQNTAMEGIFLWLQLPCCQCRELAIYSIIQFCFHCNVELSKWDAVQRRLVTVNPGPGRAYSWSGRVTAMILLCNPPPPSTHSRGLFKFNCIVRQISVPCSQFLYVCALCAIFSIVHALQWMWSGLHIVELSGMQLS